MDKMRQMDDAYADKVTGLMSGNVATKAAMVGNSYMAGLAAPVSTIREIRSDINNEPMTAGQRNQDLRGVLAMEMGAAGRYGIPAAGAGLAVAGIGSMVDVYPDLGEQAQANQQMFDAGQISQKEYESNLMALALEAQQRSDQA